jgi:hypothetical protein
LAANQFDTKRSRVNIFCVKENINGFAKDLVDPPILEVRLHCDISNFFESSFDNRQQIYMQVIDSGLSVAEQFMPLPRKYCLERLRKFSQNGYLNEWVYLDKEWKNKGIRSLFRCSVSKDEFSQTQEVYIDGNLVCKEIIAKTKPREFLFHEYLGKATLINGNEIQYTKNNRMLSIYNLETETLTFPSENINA